MLRVPRLDLARVLALCAPVWPQLAGRRLLITGGTGFFGTWLLEALATANETYDLGLLATVVSRSPGAYLGRFEHLRKVSAFTWVSGAPMDFPCPAHRHDFLLHLATHTSAHLNQTDARVMLWEKLTGIRHVIDIARRTGIPRALVTSSGAIYGRQPHTLAQLPEIYCGAPDPMDPASAYGNGKRLIEQYCAVHDDLDIVIARCFSFIGPHLPLDGRFAIGNFIRDALSGGPITLRGDGTPVRSYLYAGDLVVWLLTLLVNGEGRTAYNVGSDYAITLLELAQRISARTGNTPIRVLQTPRAVPGERYVPCTARARLHAGLQVFTDLDTAIQQTLDWHLRSTAQKGRDHGGAR